MEYGSEYLNKTYEIKPLHVINHVFKHMGIGFWGVSIIPFYMSWVFASHTLFAVPGQSSLFIELILGLIVIGPLLAGSTLMFNDYWDMEVDKSNRRKLNKPLAMGLIPQSIIYRFSIFLMIFAVLTALYISFIFALFISASVFLSIIYSSIPIRIKNRPGFDLILNATGAGVFCSFAGWVLINPITEYPFFWLVPMFFGVAAIYLPTTIIDYPSDKRNGINTIAVKLGQQKTFYLGLVCIGIANAAIILMGLNNYLITPRFVYVVWPIALAQVIMYWYLLRKQTFKNVIGTIAGLASLLSFGNILLILHYTGYFDI
jgi:chlorophyll synthase